ncbi:MAG: 50S ribosomal protein L5 [Proteobacteria bacterium]|nr:50S ribosomal protein L5 [Pseudomonadota bacterium]
MARLLEKYRKEVIPALKAQFKYKNVMQVPKMEKIVVNVSTADALTEPKVLEAAQREIAAITGQRPVITKAKKSIAGFKLREGQKLGVAVTLRREKMYEFFDRLINLALPRVRDFRGLSPKAFDGKGNYTLGLKEQIVFPEINYDKIDKTRGMNITIVTTAQNDDEGRALLAHMGMPFRQ